MSVLIKQRKKDGRFRFWTTISDGWLTDWLDKKEAVKYLQFREKEQCKYKCEEIAAKFPHGYWNTDQKFITDEKGLEAYGKLLQKRIDGYK